MAAKEATATGSAPETAAANPAALPVSVDATPTAPATQPEPRAIGGVFTMHAVGDDFTPNAIHDAHKPEELLGCAVFDFDDRAGRQLICHWKDHDALDNPCRTLEDTHCLPAAKLPVRSAARSRRVTRTFLGCASATTIATVLATVISGLVAHDQLAAMYYRVARRPLDVGVRALAHDPNISLNKPFTVRFAVENYTDWCKSYVRLDAVMTRRPEAANGAAPPPRPPPVHVQVEPPDLQAVETSGRAYVEVTTQVADPGTYDVVVSSLPLYQMPSASDRRKSWDEFASGEPEQGVRASGKITLLAHDDEEFVDRHIDQDLNEGADKNKCAMSVTLVTGRAYPNGLRITAYSPPRYRIRFHSVSPSIEGSVDTSAGNDRAVENGAFLNWETEKTEALERRGFSIMLESQANAPSFSWNEAIKSITFSVAPIQNSHKP